MRRARGENKYKLYDKNKVQGLWTGSQYPNHTNLMEGVWWCVLDSLFYLPLILYCFFSKIPNKSQNGKAHTHKPKNRNQNKIKMEELKVVRYAM